MCDFSLQSDTEGLVRELLAGGRTIEVLVNNVGVLNHKLTFTAEGREQTFTTNLLSELLLEQICPNRLQVVFQDVAQPDALITGEVLLAFEHAPARLLEDRLKSILDQCARNNTQAVVICCLPQPRAPVRL